MLTAILIAAALAGVPANDECTVAQLIETGLTSFATSNATTSTDPYDDQYCLNTYLGDMNQDVWFR